MTALATRPEDLRVAARRLQVAREEMGELATRLVTADTVTATTWQGAAALGHRMATQRVVAAVRDRCGPVGDSAAALDTLAGQADRERAIVHAAQRERAEATAERLRQIGLLNVVTDPGEVAAIRARIMALESVIRRADDAIAWAEERLEQGRRIVDRVLRDSWLGVGVDELGDLIGAGSEVAPVWRGGGLVVVGTRVLLASVRLARDLDPFARFALEARLAKLLTVVRKTPIFFLLTRLPYRFVVPLVVIHDAWPDVRDGGGYEGWRGFTLRVTAALAIPGSVAMVLPHPVVAGIGAVTVGAYYLVKGGYAFYDHRLLLTRVGLEVYERRHEIIRVARKVLQPTEAFPLGPLGPMYPLLPNARDLLSDLPRLEELSRYLPPWGHFMPLVQAPIEAGPRLPAIPPPSLGVVGAGIVLPRLIRLFR
ncbi:hypothetical protein MWU75_03850 [Ornithinimicrobium sp. F0845]|uniref:hypothetical protein n=1 Tax=Ornithinimicrobium sp. F0845 TaxID=2926412 RepID=UPI001FF6C14D|nr:hypothetical protein [Ornithinimicrobium sp. F0845]MCK0111272.1 hypothetical protein [Ornithinimicrobium sp. F0845]